MGRARGGRTRRTLAALLPRRRSSLPLSPLHHAHQLVLLAFANGDALFLEERHGRIRLDDVRVLLIEVRCRRDGLLVLAVARAAFVDVGDVELGAPELLLETFFL